MKTAFPYLPYLFLFTLDAVAAPHSGMPAHEKNTSPPPRAEPAPSGSSRDAPALSELTRQALSRNSSIKAARAKWNAMKARVPQAAAWEDLEFGADNERAGTNRLNTFSDIEYMVSQTLPLSGKNRVAARMAMAEAAASFQDFRRAELDVVSKVRAAWYRIGLANAQLAINGKDATEAAQLVEAARVRFEAGAAGNAASMGVSDVLDAELELGRLRETRANLERRVSEGGADLGVLLESDFASPNVALPSIFAHAPTPDSLEARALQSRPEILAAREKAVAAREQVELARRNWIPDPQVRIEAREFRGSAGIREYDTGIFFKAPWLNRDKYKAAEAEAAANLEVARGEIAASQSLARGLIRTQLARIEAAERNAALYQEKLLPVVRETLEAQRVGWETGRAQLRDLLLARRSQRELESQLLEQQAEKLMALAELDAVIGKGGAVATDKPIASSKPAPVAGATQRKPNRKN